MKKLMLATQKFIRREEGVTAIEYALIAALIAIIAIVAMTNIGTGINTTFEAVVTALTNANS